ncbi:DVU0150 family protein [Desulfobulbus oligotrophicus]
MQWFWRTVPALILFAPGLSLAAGGGGAPMVIVADTRKLDGILAWWGNMYNESHLQFAILTIIIIPVTGVLFGIVADIVMGWIGIDLKTRELAED